MPDIRLPKYLNFEAPSCQGCGHGLIIRLMAEACEELGIAGKTILVRDVAAAEVRAVPGMWIRLQQRTDARSLWQTV